MKNALEKLQGTWVVTELEIEGQAAPAMGESKIVVNGRQFTTIAMGAVYEGTIEVDDSARPRTFDLHFTSGPEAGNTSLGIYELKGDTWKICLTLFGSKRPTKFATSAGSGLALETLRREGSGQGSKAGSKKFAGDEPKQAVAEVDIPDAVTVDFGPDQAIPELAGEWHMVSCVRDGYALDERMVKTAKRVAEGNETTTTFGAKVFMKAKFRVDRTTEPKQIDYLLMRGPSKGQLQYGIYELTASDLKLCFRDAGNARPEDFTTSLGDGKLYTIWRQTVK